MCDFCMIDHGTNACPMIEHLRNSDRTDVGPQIAAYEHVRNRAIAVADETRPSSPFNSSKLDKIIEKKMQGPFGSNAPSNNNINRSFNNNNAFSNNNTNNNINKNFSGSGSSKHYSKGFDHKSAQTGFNNNNAFSNNNTNNNINSISNSSSSIALVNSNAIPETDPSYTGWKFMDHKTKCALEILLCNKLGFGTEVSFGIDIKGKFKYKNYFYRSDNKSYTPPSYVSCSFIFDKRLYFSLGGSSIIRPKNSPGVCYEYISTKHVTPLLNKDLLGIFIPNRYPASQRIIPITLCAFGKDDVLIFTGSHDALVDLTKGIRAATRCSQADKALVAELKATAAGKKQMEELTDDDRKAIAKFFDLKKITEDRSFYEGPNGPY